MEDTRWKHKSNHLLREKWVCVALTNGDFARYVAIIRDL